MYHENNIHSRWDLYMTHNIAYRPLISLGITPDNKAHGDNMGPTWVLSAPDGPHVGLVNLAIKESKPQETIINLEHN